MKRILCSLLVVTLPFGSVLADAPKSKNAKVTLVYQHELPSVPGKSIKGVLVEYGPGGYSPGHTHAKSAFIYATVLEGAIRSQVNDEAGQAPRGVRGGHKRDGTDDPIRELSLIPFVRRYCVAGKCGTPKRSYDGDLLKLKGGPLRKRRHKHESGPNPSLWRTRCSCR